MEWSRSSITAEEMERRQREYIEAAMSMAKKAAGNAPVQKIAEEIVQPEKESLVESVTIEPEQLSVEETETAAEPEEKIESEAEIPVQGEQKPAEKAEETVQDEEKTTFGVFDRDELEAAAENGTVSDEGLKRAAEILAEMTNKTEEMRRVYGQPPERENNSSQPQSLGGYVNRHNGSCPRCGQAHNGSRR